MQTTKRGLSDEAGLDLVDGEQGNPRLEDGNKDNVPPFLCQTASGEYRRRRRRREEEDVVVVAAAAAACNPSRRIPAAWKGVKNEKGNKLRHLTNLLIHLHRDT